MAIFKTSKIAVRFRPRAILVTFAHVQNSEKGREKGRDTGRDTGRDKGKERGRRGERAKNGHVVYYIIKTSGLILTLG